MAPDIAIARTTIIGAARTSRISVLGGCATQPTIVRTFVPIPRLRGSALELAISEICHKKNGDSGSIFVIQCAAAQDRAARDLVVRDCIETLQELLTASAARVWICNRDLAVRSHDLWHMLDHCGSSRIGLWLDIETLVARGESPSVFLKQLAQFARAVAWRFDTLTPLARGEEIQSISRAIEVLKGLAFRGLLVVDDVPPESDPRASLVDAIVAKLQELWCRPVVVLTAYKGDKHAPRFAAR